MYKRSQLCEVSKKRKWVKKEAKSGKMKINKNKSGVVNINEVSIAKWSEY